MSRIKAIDPRSVVGGTKARLDALRQSVVEGESEVKTLNTRLADTQAAVERARQAQAVVEEAEEAHTTYLTARSSLEELETERDARDRMKETLQSHQTELALNRQQVEGLQKDLEDVATAETQMAALEPQVAEQEKMESSLTEAERAAQQLKDKQKELFGKIVAANEKNLWVVGLVHDPPDFYVVELSMFNVPKKDFQSWTYPNPGPVHPEQFFFAKKK